LKSHDRYVHQILTELEGESLVSQRSLATRLGIALGLTNLLVRRLIRKGWIRAVRIRPNRFRYLLTPTGLAEKARISFIFLQDYVQFYATARDRVRERLSVLALRWPASELGSAAEKRIVFYGAGEVAEIAYVCLQGTDLKLVGVIDETGRERFLGLDVQSSDSVRDGFIGGTPFDHLVVTSFENRDAIRARLGALGIAAERVHWL
jgi:hypothetical protein